MTSTESSDVIEQKKWLVNRFEVRMEGSIGDIKATRDTINSVLSRIEIGYKELRTIILAAVGLIVSVIVGIAGIAYTQLGISYPYIITIILSTIIVGTGLVVLVTILRQRAYSIILEVDTTLLSVINKLNKVYFRFVDQTATTLDDVEIHELAFFYFYLLFAYGAVRLPERDVYGKVFKSRLFRSINIEMGANYLAINKVLDSTVNNYKAWEQIFHQHKDNFSALRSIHDPFLKEYGIVYPYPQINEDDEDVVPNN